MTYRAAPRTTRSISDTIRSIQDGVGTCIATFESQQDCHDVRCVTEPANNAIFCDTQAGDLVDRILDPVD